jgi:N-acetylmuramoyl-L-alanine amidase
MKITKVLLCFVLLVSLFIPFGSMKAEASTTFKDISSNHPAYKEITYLAQGEIVNGTLSGYFNPNSTVTRAEAITMVGRALGLNGTQRSTDFTDVGSGNFASGYIQSAVDKNLLSGYGDGTFRPYTTVTRGEMAVIISKAFGYSFGNTLSGAANALKSRGIAQAVSDGSFGSKIVMDRVDVALFLARAINYKFRLNSTVSFDKKLFITTNSLNIRTGPSVKYPSVGTLDKGDAVTSAYSVGNWSYIKSGSQQGFVSLSYLSTSPNGTAISATNSPLAEKTIVIDPGHGGKDPGAVGYGLYEKTVVLDTALKVKALLKQTPFDVQLTRETDVFPELSERVAFAKNRDADIFVSIHANASNGSASGTETYYYAAATNPHVQDSKALATYIQKRLITAWNLNNRGVKDADYYVLKQNSMPAVLAELGFIDNKSDNNKLKSAAYRQLAADAIYLGILDYYKAKGYDVTSLYNIVK